MPFRRSFRTPRSAFRASSGSTHRISCGCASSPPPASGRSAPLLALTNGELNLAGLLHPTDLLPSSELSSMSPEPPQFHARPAARAPAGAYGCVQGTRPERVGAQGAPLANGPRHGNRNDHNGSSGRKPKKRPQTATTKTTQPLWER